MGVVFAHYIADDAGALAGGAIGGETHLLHGVENAAMYGLQSVADVGQRTADDDRHRVVEIRPTHLVFNVDGLNVQGAGGAAVAWWWSQWEFGILIVCHRKISSQLSAISYQPSAFFGFRRVVGASPSGLFEGLGFLVNCCI